MEKGSLVLMALKQLFSTGGIHPQGTLGNIWRHFWLARLARGGDWGSQLLASSGLRPRMLLCILQCTGQPPTPKNYPTCISFLGLL